MMGRTRYYEKIEKPDLGDLCRDWVIVVVFVALGGVVVVLVVVDAIAISFPFQPN